MLSFALRFHLVGLLRRTLGLCRAQLIAFRTIDGVLRLPGGFFHVAGGDKLFCVFVVCAGSRAVALPLVLSAV